MGVRGRVAAATLGPMRRSMVLLIACAGILALCAPAAQAAKHKVVTCGVKGGTTEARHGGQRLITREGPDDDLYGPATSVYACRQAHRPAVLLEETQEGTSISIAGVRFTRWFVVYSARGSSSQCTKYQPGAPECFYAYVASFDLRTGARKAITDGFALSPVLSTKGWFAWVSAPDPLGSRTVIGVDGTGGRTLDEGGIDPASLAFAGSRLGWRRDGAAQSAALG